MRYFNHVNARTVEEAVGILKRYQGGAVINAGGTDLLGVLRDRILSDYPEAVINIKGIADLEYIREEPAALRIGAATRLADIARAEGVKRSWAVLGKTAAVVATPQIRNMATIGGNLCQDVRCWYYRYPEHMGGRMMCLRKGARGCFAVRGDNRYHAIFGGNGCFAVCPSDMAVTLTALDAEVSLTGPDTKRTVPIGSFYSTMGNALQTDEIVTEIRVPKPPYKSVQDFMKFTLRKPVDFAVVSAACVIALDNGTCRDARIVLGAVAPVPVRATGAEETIKGEVIDETIASEAAEVALAGASPLGMNDYKIAITKALVKQALLKDVERTQ